MSKPFLPSQLPLFKPEKKELTEEEKLSLLKMLGLLEKDEREIEIARIWQEFLEATPEGWPH